MKWRVIVLLVILTVIHKVRSHNRRRQIRESFNRQSQVFVVTGGASGIGRHLTGCLLARGHKVVSCDINHEALQASYEESWKPTAGARIIIAKLDVRSPEQWAEALQLGVQTFGSLDVLLNIAGYIHPGAAAEFDLKQLDLHIDINTKVRTPLVLLSLESLTTLLTCVALSFSFLFFSFLWPACHAQGMIIGSQLAAQHMLKQGKGHIVNIASTAGIFFPCGLSLYGASKVSPPLSLLRGTARRRHSIFSSSFFCLQHGIRGFTRTMALELADKGVAVTCFCPDAVQTPMLQKQYAFSEAAVTFSAPQMVCSLFLSSPQVSDR